MSSKNVAKLLPFVEMCKYIRQKLTNFYKMHNRVDKLYFIGLRGYKAVWK